MPENPSGAADAATATPTPAAGTPTATAPVAAPTAPEIAAPSKDDWAGMAKSIREIAKSLSAVMPQQPPPKTETPKPATADAVAEKLAVLEFRLGLKEAMSAAGITDRLLAEVVEKAAMQDKPADLAAYVAKYAALKPAGAPAAIPAAVTPPIAPSNTGTPAPNPSAAALPDNPLLWPPDVVRKTSAADFQKALAEYDARTGKGDPLRALRRPRR